MKLPTWLRLPGLISQTQADRIEADCLQILSNLSALSASENTNWANANELIVLTADQVSQILTIVNDLIIARGTAIKVEVGIPFFTNSSGTVVMADSISFADDAVAHIKLTWRDAIGVVSPPADASASSDNAAVCSAGLENAGSGLVITPVAGATGSAHVTVSGNAGMASDVVSVTITAPAASSVSADTAAATFTPLGP